MLILLLASLLAGVAWTGYDRLRATQHLRSDRQNLLQCQQVADKIRTLRHQKQRAQLKSKPTDELNRRLDAWAAEAGVEPARLVRIEPQEPRRVGDTNYLEQVTELELTGVPLAQIVKLAQLAESSETGLQLTSLRMSPPRTVAEEELWNAELALTYFIYAPKTARP